MENEANPYQSPQADSEMRPPAAPKRRSRLFWLVLPTVAGMAIGTFFTGPGHNVGYPNTIAGGCGGFLGLAVGFVLRQLYPGSEVPPSKE